MRVADTEIISADAMHGVSSPRSNLKRINHKKFAFNIHSVLGAIAAIYILLMSLSGAVLVFHEELTELVAPSTRVAVRSEFCSIQKLLASAHNRYPDRTASWIHNSAYPNRACELRLEKPAQPQITLEFDPYIGTLFREKKIPLIPFLEDLHFNLLLGDKGRFANCFGATILLALTASGLIVWWNRARSWRNRFKVELRAPHAVAWDLHRTAGAAAFAFLTVWGISGIYFCFPTEVKQVVALVLPFAAPANPTVPPPCKKADLQSIDTLLSETRRKHPNHVVLWAKVPSPESPTMSVFLKKRGAEFEDGFLTLELDARSGKLLSSSGPGDTKYGDQFLGWLSKLHMGSFGGIPVKALWTSLASLPASLAVTGFYIWWRRKSHRNHRAKR